MNETVERIIATIDAERFAAIAARHADDYAAKYLDLPRWIGRNLRRVVDAKLDLGARRRVLDVGCGAGYFLYICKLLGHDVLGIDLPGRTMYPEITELLGVPVVETAIEPMVPLPQLGGFDTVTAHMIVFNGHLGMTCPLWGPAEWGCFLDSLETRSLYLDLNRELTGVTISRELEQYFASRGGAVRGYHVAFERLT